MKLLVRTNASAVWVLLSVLTLVSWLLGSYHCIGENQRPASLIIVAVAVFKMRLVGLYFMELRCAPSLLRRLFESYCLLLFGLLTVMLLAG